MAQTMVEKTCRFETVATEMMKIMLSLHNGIKVSWKKIDDAAHVFLESPENLDVKYVYNMLEVIRKNGFLDELDATSIPCCYENRFKIRITPFGML